MWWGGRIAVFLAFLGFAPLYANPCETTLKPLVVYKDVQTILDAKCSVCHRGPFLDTSSFPFKYDKETDQRAIVRAFLERMYLEDSNWQKMPPLNGVPMKKEEIDLIESWLKYGLKP